MTETVDYGTFEATLERSNRLELALQAEPSRFLVLTGDRPTGRLHVGHLFGSVENRVRLQNMGVPIFVVIADYQVLTDRDYGDDIAANVHHIVLDYVAAGLDPDNGRTSIFPHSHVPELNQLLVPFLTLVTNAELNRNPTVKEEIQASGRQQINAGMYTYPVHQAADILFCKASVVPVGKDQLPHLELTRAIARRFNARFAPDRPVFPEPQPLLSSAPAILGLDGSAKMSKSRNNAIELSFSEDETAAHIKTAKTDVDRLITYDPERRPEVANLLLLLSLCTKKTPEDLASEIGDAGASRLKSLLTEALNEYLRPLRQRRRELEQEPGFVGRMLNKGIAQAREVAQQTLAEVRQAMGMAYGIGGR
ncbi:MAG: tryptophan--tRNA ligase [Dehalococcoidia bacterium]|nr:tryptophan--tRNA ligase [Dehalococcoidia bacterium]